MPRCLPLIALLGLATACQKEDSEPTIDFGPNNGFTMRTPTNVPTGQTDPTDWTTDAPWNTHELALFSSLNLPLLDSQLPAGTWQLTSYPNPSTRADGASFTVLPAAGAAAGLPAGPVRIHVVIVDKHYQLLTTYDEVVRAAGTTVTFRFDPLQYGPGKLLRLYYVVYEPGKQVYYRGHGDLKLDLP